MSDKYDRVYRGGSSFYGPRGARVARRIYDSPGARSNDLGLRLVEEVEDPAPKSDRPRIPRCHRFVIGGSWRFMNAKYDRKRAYPQCAKQNNIGIRLVEEIDE